MASQKDYSPLEALSSVVGGNEEDDDEDYFLPLFFFPSIVTFSLGPTKASYMLMLIGIC